MPDRAIQAAAAELHGAVAALEELITRNYPDRKEVERRFISKESSRKRIKWIVLVVLGSAVASFAFSVVTTVTVVSTCFLGADPRHPGVCEWMPGYQEAIDQNEEILDQFNQLIATTEKNRQKIEKLEAKASR